MLEKAAKTKWTNPVLGGIRRELSLLKKVFVVSPMQASLSVVLSIVARITSLLTLVLPLKSIMVAASPEVPDFILHFFPGVEKGTVVVALGLLTVLFYFLDMMVDSVSDRIAEHGGAAIVRRVNKINPTVDVQAETTTHFKNLVRIQSAIVFTLIVGVVLSLFYLRLVVVIAAILLAILGALAILCAYPSIRDRLYDARIVVQGRVNFAATMLVFMFIVLDTMTGQVSSALLAIIGLVLSRQLLVAVGEYTRLTINLMMNRTHIENLFFHTARTAAPVPLRPSKGLWTRLSADTMQSEVSATVSQALGRSVEPTRVAWRETGVFDVASFDVDLPNEEDATPQRLLVKIFKDNRRLLAAHEELLLSSKAATALPAPRLIARTDIDDCPCLIMESPGTSIPEILDYKSSVFDLLGNIWAVRIPPNIMGPFQRSTPCAIAQLDDSIIDRVLMGATGAESQSAVIELKARLNEIKERVLALPMALHNPELYTGTVARRGDGKLVATHWARWVIEPVGSALWAVDGTDETGLAGAVAHVVKVRKDCAHLTIDHLRLAGYLYLLLKQCHRQSYGLASKTAIQVIACVTALDISRAA